VESLVKPDDAVPITAKPHREVVLLADREQLSITRSRYGPGERGPDPHVHREHTDAFYVLEGELSFALGSGAERVRVPAGTYVAVPPNLVHSFLNDGSADAHFLNFHAPDGGFAAFMRGRRDGRDVGFDSFDPPDDGGRPATEAIVSGPGEGERLRSRNRVATLKGATPALSLGEWELDGPFGGPEPHHHDAEVDAFYVLDGELAMTLDGSVHEAGPGTLAAVPRGTRHKFAHDRPGRARFLNLHAPDGGFADYLRGISNG
jgi:quercetin dioxygenase-like cupin family protein